MLLFITMRKIRLNIRTKVALYFMILAAMVAYNFIILQDLNHRREVGNLQVQIAWEAQHQLEAATIFAREVVEGRRTRMNDLSQKIEALNLTISKLENGYTTEDGIILPPASGKQAALLAEVNRLWKNYRLQLEKVKEVTPVLDSTFRYFNKESELTPEEMKQLYEAGVPLGDAPTATDFMDDPFGSSPFGGNPFGGGGASQAEEYVQLSFSYSLTNPVLKPVLNYFVAQHPRLSLYLESLREQYRADLELKISHKVTLLYWVWTFMWIAMLAGFLFIMRMAISPINKLRYALGKIAEGDLNLELPKKRDDEIGELAASVNFLTKSLKKVSDFAASVGKGDYDMEFEARSEADKLSYSLLEMRENLMRSAEEDRIRNWTNEGLAKFGDLLRNHAQNLDDLAYHVASGLANYLDINQVGFFIVREKDGQEVLELKAAYAYNKHKYMQRTVHPGQGLLGELLQEQQPILLKKVPEDYIEVTSGMGKAVPRFLFLTPLFANEEIHGALEVAAFEELPEYQISFIKKISESIAATIASVQSGERTRELLEDSQLITEQMRAQEEEMRQNMEELTATQEEMERSQEELRSKSVRLSYLINSNEQAMLSFSEDYKIIAINPSAQRFLKREFAQTLEEGSDLPERLQEDFAARMRRIRRGEKIVFVQNKKDIDWQDIYIKYTLFPLRNEKEEIMGAGLILEDITWIDPIRWAGHEPAPKIT